MRKPSTLGLTSLACIGGLLTACGGGGENAATPVQAQQGPAPLSVAYVAEASRFSTGSSLAGGDFVALASEAPGFLDLPVRSLNLGEAEPILAAPTYANTGDPTMMADGLSLIFHGPVYRLCADGHITIEPAVDRATVTFNDCKYDRPGTPDGSMVRSGVVKITRLGTGSYTFELKDFRQAGPSRSISNSNGSFTFTSTDTGHTVTVPSMTQDITKLNEHGKVLASRQETLRDFSRVTSADTTDRNILTKGRLVVTGGPDFDISFDNTATDSTDQAVFWVKNDADHPYMGRLLVTDNRNSSTKLVITAQSDAETYVVRPTINGVLYADQTFDWIPSAD